jgi:cation transport ATPase
MKLTQDQIQSIDTYLIKSDIRFIDVRMELVDHIANAIEHKIKAEQLSFYDTFKAYMVENKRDLIKNYERLKKKNQMKGFGLVLQNLKKPISILIFALSCLLFFNFEVLFGFVFPFIPVMWTLLIATSLIYITFSYPFKKNRFSGLEALSWVMFSLSYLFQVLFNFAEPKPLFYEQAPVIITVFVAIISTFCIAWIVTFFEQRKNYRIKYGQL